MTTLRHRCFSWHASLDCRTRIVLFAVILLAAQPLLVGELSVLLSPHKDTTVLGVVSGFVILVAILAVLLTALLRRRKWAWLALVLLFGSAVVLDAFTRHGVLNFIRDVTGLALLMSPPMLRYVNRTDASDRPQGPTEDGL